MGGEDSDKLIRVPGDNLVIKLTPDEVKYRNKYLPEPTKLTDEKLVCTVCSLSLAHNIHKGKDIFVHRVLQVLVCEVCYNFYGDGCFSADEDGDDKYCRWCGQGGTLFLCSKCSCAFCKKCIEQNLKPSVLAELDNDDWKCYICSPRPLFGCRTICWGAEELNKIGKAKELERQKKQKERLEKMEEKKKEERKSRKVSGSEDEDVSVTKKRKMRARDSDSSSPEVMPAKKSRRDTRSTLETSMNGSIGKMRRKRKDSSSDDSSEGQKKVFNRRSRSTSKKNKKAADSSSEESDIKNRSKTKLKKKKSRASSDELSEESKKNSKRKTVQKKVDSSDEESSDEKHRRKKSLPHRKTEETTDSSSDERRKKKKLRRKKKETSSEELSDNNRKSKTVQKKKKGGSSEDDTDDIKKNKRKSKIVKENKKKEETPDSDNDVKGKKANDESKSKDVVDNAIARKRIKLAILWLNNTIKDISELGSLISVRATKFCKKKINSENLKSYEDVLNTVNKLKQLISGIHSNYDHIEKSLEAHLKPWKILTGLEEPENEKPDEESSHGPGGDIPEAVDPSKETNDKSEADTDSKQIVDENVNKNIKPVDSKSTEKEGNGSENNVEMNLHWSGLSSADESDTEEKNATKALINIANETLTKDDEIEKTDQADKAEKQAASEVNEVDSVEKDEKQDSKQENDTVESINDSNDTKQSDPDDDKSDPEKKPSKKHVKKSPVKSNKEEAKKETPKKSSHEVEDGSEKDIKTSPKKKESPEKTAANEEPAEEEPGEELPEDGSSQESKQVEAEPSGVESIRLNSSNDAASLSEEDTSLEFFSKKIQIKWRSEEQPAAEMNLKTSLGIESSGESGDGMELADQRSDETAFKKEKEGNKEEDKTRKKQKSKDIDEDEKRRETIKKSKKGDLEAIQSSKKDKKPNEEVKEENENKRDRKRKLKNEGEEKKNRNEKEKKKRNSEEKESSDEEQDNIKTNKKDKKDKDDNKNKSVKSEKKVSSDEEQDNIKTNKKDKTHRDDDKKKSVKSEKKVSSDEEQDNIKTNKKDKKDRDDNKKKSVKSEKKVSSDEEQDNIKTNKKDKKDRDDDKKKSVKSEKKVSSDEEQDNIKTNKKDKKDRDDNKKKSVKSEKKVSSDEEQDNIKTNKKDKKDRDDNKKQSMKSENKVIKEKEENSDEMEESVKNKAATGNAEEKEIVKEKNSESNNTEKDNKQEKDINKKNVGLDSSSEEKEKSDVEKNESVSEVIEIKDDPVSESDDVKTSKSKGKCLRKRSERNRRRPVNMLESSDEDENKSDRSDEKDNGIKEDDDDGDKSVSVVDLSSTDSSDSEILNISKKRKKKKDTSDSDVKTESEEDKKKKKRKRIRCADSSDSDGSGEIDISKKSTQGESPGKGGRKNIKKIKGKDDLAEATLEAAEEEKERRKRIEERQKLFNKMFEIKETAKLDKLVLDFDPEEKKELLSVDKDLVAKMKPHQAKGVKFMWDSCFESISELKKKKGSGCILAHCMGLGKTFQVISLVHTVLMEPKTKVNTVMVVCPLSTVLNWYNEFEKWLEDIKGGSDIEVFHLTKCKQNNERACELRRWQHNGGVLILGYEMFRNLSNESTKKFRAKLRKDFQECLIDPGADMIICDEGHMLKNEATALSKAMSRVKTLRRIVLTGTPMQNNLKEYHCMVQFVKPNLLGTRKEFLNRFVNPITNGQFVDSTDSDVKVMKRRAHVLHKMLEGLVQRFDYNVLTPFLPPKHEYVISLCLTEQQVKLYRYYLDNCSQLADGTKAGSRLFQDWQALGRIWTHPRVLKMSTEKANLLREKKMLEASDDEEGSLKDFIDDGSDEETTPEESSAASDSDASIKSDRGKKKRVTRRGGGRVTRSSRSNAALLESEEEEGMANEEETPEETNPNKGEWWCDMVEPQHLEDINQSTKLILLFGILRECELIEDKVLVFSQSLFSLDLIEYFLDKIDDATQNNQREEHLGNHQGTWCKGLDYFRLDGSTSSENRNLWCKAFNREDNPRARLFLISTRAGGLGINLTAANRVIIFDASWNPSHDVQSIFRVYRFGQKKPCYIYRFIAHGTMEEKVYDRQVAKQSMSNRVVDEQQVHRHFSMNDLNELYTFTPPSKVEDRPTPALPTDPLLAEILTQFREWIEKYHEHDSLLENVEEETLTEEERKLAWEDFENDKKRDLNPPQTSGAYNNSMSQKIEFIRQQLLKKYPTKTKEEINNMLVYQVSLLMRQEQMAAKMQLQNMQAGNPLMYPAMNVSPEQFNLQQQQLRLQYLQQMQMKQAQQQQQSSNLKTLLNQGAMPNYQQLMMQQANLMGLQNAALQMQPNMAQTFLQNQLMQPTNTQLMNKQLIPNMNVSQALKQKYDAARQLSTDAQVAADPKKPSDSSKK